MKNRWIQFGSAVTAMIMIANLQYAWTLFSKPMQRDHKGWSAAGVGLAFTLFINFETWITPVEGWIIDRLGPRIFLSFGGVLVGLGWTGMGFANNLVELCLLYSVAGIGAAFIYSGSISTALKWFPDKRGLVSGLITAGFGAGSALFIPMISFLIQPHPLHLPRFLSFLSPVTDYLARTSNYHRAFLYTGIAQGILILIAAQFLSNPGPEFKVSKVARKEPSPRLRRTTKQFNSIEMLQTPHFYLLHITFIMISMGGLMLTAHAGEMADSFKLSAALTGAVALSRLSNGAGRIFWGWISDRIGREMAMFIPYVLQAFGLIAVLTLGRRSGAWFTFTMVVAYFIWGSMFSLFPAIIGDYFGADNATSNYGFLYTAKGLSSILAGYIAGFFFDKFHNWNVMFYSSAALALMAGILVLVVRAMPLPARQQAERTAGAGLAEAG